MLPTQYSAATAPAGDVKLALQRAGWQPAFFRERRERRREQDHREAGERHHREKGPDEHVEHRIAGKRREDHAHALGLRRRTIVVGHVLPNSVGPTIVQATLSLATAIIEVASLSYLGLGESDPAVAEWGRMLVAAQDRFDVAPQLALLPGVAIAVTALGFTLLGEAMREAIDPRSRR